MPGSSTVVVVREDLTIPGADEGKLLVPGSAAAERAFFELVRDSRPDVVVLDLSNSEGRGIEVIRKIRHRFTVPILVVCRPDDPRAGDYRIAGAAECLPAPVDILVFNEMILRIKRLTRPEDGKAARHQGEAVTFAGIAFRPAKNTLSGANGAVVRLTTAEQVLMSQFVSRPWTICSRGELGEILYGRHRPKSDRAIDVIVARLRKKLASLVGPSVEDLVQTKHRWGYMLAADVSTIRQPDEPPILSFDVLDAEAQAVRSAEPAPV